MDSSGKTRGRPKGSKNKPKEISSTNDLPDSNLQGPHKPRGRPPHTHVDPS